MKNETARQEIESLDYYLQNHTNDYSEESHTAMMMAIKALEQQPCKDAISRQAVLASIKNLYPDIPVMDIFGSRQKWLEKYAPYFECENAIEQLPPVTPQPKIGHWITKEAYSEDKAMGFTEQIVCSNCDMQNSYFSEWDKCKNPISKTFIRSKFCPNCGCRMFEPQESEKE